MGRQVRETDLMAGHLPPTYGVVERRWRRPWRRSDPAELSDTLDTQHIDAHGKTSRRKRTGKVGEESIPCSWRSKSDGSWSIRTTDLVGGNGFGWGSVA